MARTYPASPDRPRSRAQAPPGPRLPLPAGAWVSSLCPAARFRVAFSFPAVPAGRGGGPAQACRRAALRCCNCGMPWAPSASSWNPGMAGVLMPTPPQVRSESRAGRGRPRLQPGWLLPRVRCGPSRPLAALPRCWGANEARERWFPRGPCCTPPGLGHRWPGHNRVAPGRSRRGLGMLLGTPYPNHGLWGRPAATLREVRPAEQGSACRSGLAFRRQESMA